MTGGIGEIEVQNPGSGYETGFLKIEDFSGNGAGAQASYQVDSFGRISSITIIDGGTGYDLDSTVISVDNPRGGTGFVAGTVRFPLESGTVQNRTGGGRVHRIEMLENGTGYQMAASTEKGLESILTIEGNGIDSDSDGLADAKVNPARVHIDSKGGFYLEQRFDVEILSTTSLTATTLTISDANQSIQIAFADTATSSGLTIGITGKSLTQIRDDLIGAINTQWSDPTSLVEGPLIDNNSSGGTAFQFSALSGGFSTNNPSSICTS